MLILEETDIAFHCHNVRQPDKQMNILRQISHKQNLYKIIPKICNLISN